MVTAAAAAVGGSDDMMIMGATTPWGMRFRSGDRWSKAHGWEVSNNSEILNTDIWVFVASESHL